MSSNSEPSINWDPYTQDIVSLYIKQNKTAEETIQYLRENHGLQATLRQFKYRFGGKKKITEKEWTTGIIPEIKKRALEDKESDVYFHGDKLNPKRLKRGIDRYVAEVSRDFMDLDTSTASPPIDPIPEVHQDVAKVTLPEIPAPIRRCISPKYVPETHVQESVDKTSTLMVTDGLSDSFGLDTIFGVSQFTLVLNLPYFQLKHPILQGTSSLGIVNHHHSGLFPDDPSTNGSFDVPITTGQPSNDLPSMLAKVIGFPYNGQIADVIPSFVTKLQGLLPEQYPGELNAQVQALSDHSQKPSIFQLFEVAAYFFSNNMLRTNQAATFVEWVIEHNHMKTLMRFLQGRQEMLTVKAFLHSLVEAGAFVKNKEFLRQLHAIGAKFDHAAAGLVEIEDPEFLAFVLSTLEPESLKGEPGGCLLRSTVRAQNIAVAELLIQAGAKVNVSLPKEEPTTPLWEAIRCANFEMVKCLVRAGADVNQRSYATDADYASTPLALAVYQKDKRIVQYLLDQNVAIEGSVRRSPLLQYAAENAPGVYKLLLKKLGTVPAITAGQLVKAADSDVQLLSDFLSPRPQVSKRMLEEAMTVALERGRTRAVVNFLDYGVDPNGSHLPESSQRPLTVAAAAPDSQSLRLQYVDLLIHAGADVNINGLLEDIIWEEDFYTPVVSKLINAGLDLTQYGPPAAEVAVYCGNTDLLVLFVDSGMPVNSYGYRVTPFQAVALRQSLELLQYIFRKGAEVNRPAFPARGYTALQAAAIDRSIEKIQFLLSMGADINALPAVTGGVTALEATVRPWEDFFNGINGDDGILFDKERYREEEGLAETFIFLLGEGAAVNRPDGSSSPLLHDIIERGGTHLLKLALEAGANTTHQWPTRSSSECERTPLQLAAEMGQVEAVKLLLDHQADPNALPARRHGMTALQAAASSEAACMETVELLLTAGAAINADPAALGGITALQGAAIKGHFQIAMLLIEKGANVNAPPAIKDGRTAVEGAAEHGRLDMVQMLLNAGAIGDVIRKTGLKKAISLARENRHFAVVELLESHRRGISANLGFDLDLHSFFSV
ncbi:ankyrin repeat-containing domain protein [Trichoderma asperelloides]|nr:ankyrin repeat-containing domain protein [Trichoderma asperelloides]